MRHIPPFGQKNFEATRWIDNCYNISQNKHEMKSNIKSLVLFSGGMDSTICLLLAIEKYGQDSVIALSFITGHKKKKSVEVGKITCQKLGVKHYIFDVRFLNKMAGETVIEGRNLFFMSFAVLYAKRHNVKNIYFGICNCDSGTSLHNDHTKRFVYKGENFINYCISTDVVWHTPLINLSKEQLWELVDIRGKLEFVNENSYSCWSNSEKPCMECRACKLREEGLRRYLDAKRKKCNYQGVMGRHRVRS